MPFDLVLLSLGGVQRFIAESRTTADVAGASEIVQRLARCAAEVIEDRLAAAPAPGGLIFPAAADAASVTNKIVFLTPAGDGPAVARAAVEKITQVWRDQLKKTFHPDPPPSTPGMPDLAWVSVTGSAAEGDYGALWQAAQQEMDGRKRARVFAPFEVSKRSLCAQSPGLPAVSAPRNVPQHERNEALSAAGRAKRQAGRVARRASGASFPSTVSVASSAFRSRLLARAADTPELAVKLRESVRVLDDALTSLDIGGDPAKLRWASASGRKVPDGLESLESRLGAWVTAERWDRDVLASEYGTNLDATTVRRAHRAAVALTAMARGAGIPAPSPYFAVVVQDLDRLGKALGGFDLNQQREVSRQLSALAREQQALIKEQHPRAELVYAGGDDLLAFCPAADALAFAQAIRAQVRNAVSSGPLATAGPDGHPITASTGVVFAHMSNPLQDAIQAAQEAIRTAKSAKRDRGPSRDALAVVVRRRGGQRAGTVLPWWPPADPDGRSATTLLELIQPGPESDALSGALGSELERDKEVLSDLGEADQALLRAELVRLVDRHGGTTRAGEALCTLGLSERGVDKGRFDPVPAALVARFLTQEAR